MVSCSDGSEQAATGRIAAARVQIRFLDRIERNPLPNCSSHALAQR
jgi:hypothetical protein